MYEKITKLASFTRVIGIVYSIIISNRYIILAEPSSENGWNHWNSTKNVYLHFPLYFTDRITSFKAAFKMNRFNKIISIIDLFILQNVFILQKYDISLVMFGSMCEGHSNQHLNHMESWVHRGRLANYSIYINGALIMSQNIYDYFKVIWKNLHFLLAINKKKNNV